MESQRKLVQSYFDRLASGYRARYEGRQVFFQYLYLERLEKALEGWNAPGKTVLDIGAGTGILYDRLPQGQDYYACDISAAMLAQSGIPQERRWVGAPRECKFPLPTFDAIFALGVTTYLTGPELSDLMGFIAERLAAGGKATLSFTNKASFDFRLRQWFLPKRLGKEFAIHAYTPEQVPDLLPSPLRIEGIRWLNATAFPFSRMFPDLSVWLSRRLLRSSIPKRWICGDFLVVLTRE